MHKRRFTTLTAIGAVVMLAAYGTFAAWTATTTNSGNSIESGTIGITDDDAGQAMFDVADLEPGDTLERCIQVTNTGSTAFDSVKLYFDPTGGDLAYHLDATIDRGTGASGFPACSGFTAVDTGIFDDVLVNAPLDVVGAITEVGDPIAGWGPGESKSYRFRIALPSDASIESAGKSVSFGVVWDAEVN